MQFHNMAQIFFTKDGLQSIFFRLLDAGIYHNSGYCETHVIDVHLISLRTLSSLIAQIVHMLVQRHTPDPIKLDFHTGNFDKLHRTLHTAQPDCHQIDPSEWEHENKHFSFIYTLHIRRQRWEHEPRRQRLVIPDGTNS